MASGFWLALPGLCDGIAFASVQALFSLPFLLHRAFAARDPTSDFSER